MEDIILPSNKDNTIYSCTLDTEQLNERVKSLQKNIFSEYKSYREIPDGYVFKYENNTENAHNLLDYILKENECCSFMDFDLFFRKDSLECSITSSSVEIGPFKNIIMSYFNPK